MALAHRLLVQIEGLNMHQDATSEELIAIKGRGKAKGVVVLAATELGKRMHRYKPYAPYVVKTPEDGAHFVMEDMRHLKQEHFVVLFLDTKNQIFHRETVFIGSLNSSVVHPSEVYREAVTPLAASIICVHDHPASDTAPSQEDIHVTKRLAEAGKFIRIHLLDHVIICDRKFVFLEEKGSL